MAITALRENLEAVEAISSQMGNVLAISERNEVLEGRRPAEPQRSGFGIGIPMGGTTEFNPGGQNTDFDRPTLMQELLQSYLTCPYASAAVDVIARTCTAGGLEVVPEATPTGSSTAPQVPPGVKKLQQLFKYVNPHQDIRQLMRVIITDLEIFGDAYIEIVYVGKEPAAIYQLDPTTMSIKADEHGTVLGYWQKTENNRQVFFKPNQVIHFKLDAPGDSLYGVSPTQKNILPIMSWLYTAALIKETMRRGDPLRAHVDWPIALPQSEITRFGQQYSTRNLGAKNIGNLFETKGGAVVRELGVNQINNWLNTMQQRRDEMLSGYGVPPSKVGVVESGNIGGGTGTSQEKTFRVNTCGPLQEIVLEKLTFHLLYMGFGVTDWYVKFGVVDWRDDEVIEQIRDQRIRNGTWTLNRARADIGEPPVPGGDKAVLVDRQNMVLWEHLEDMSSANVQLVEAQVKTANAPQPMKTGAKGANPASGNAKTKAKQTGSGGDGSKPIKSTEYDEELGGVQLFERLKDYLAQFVDDEDTD